MSGIRDRLAPCFVVVQRLLLSAWVGSAVLYVITSVAEQTNTAFDSVVRDQLATVRFPIYYAFGFWILALAVLSGLGAAVCCSGCLRKRVTAALAFTVLSLTGAVADYFWVYSPLQKLIVPPGQARTERFLDLHNQSRQINEFHLTLALIAAVLACLPARSELSKGCDVRLSESSI